MINISPIGRNCSKEERNAYEEYDLVNFHSPSATCRHTRDMLMNHNAFLFSISVDLTIIPYLLTLQKHNIRKDMVNVLKEKFGHYNLTYSIGGQISFDVFPVGWDKTYCLRFLSESDWDEIHFFGDKTFKGGNDFEIFTSPRVKGHTVTSPEDTMAQCKALFGV